jgi:hypothetical protein
MFRTTRMLRLVLVLVSALGALAAAPCVSAQSDAAAAKPDRYICPNATGTGAIDCFLNAVEHLYTMCRQVKSIEIIEFGYEKSDDGVNGAKSGYCVDKHKVSMTRPYQAALREATGVRAAVDRLRGLYDLWLKSLYGLKWKPGESDAEYKDRIAIPYSAFSEQATGVRVALDDAAAQAKVAKSGAAKGKTSAATKTASGPPAKSAN